MTSTPRPEILGEYIRPMLTFGDLRRFLDTTFVKARFGWPCHDLSMYSPSPRISLSPGLSWRTKEWTLSESLLFLEALIRLLVLEVQVCGGLWGGHK